ncbi:MAG: hypothetical protein KC502_07070 [Myxococcales bacterium]|nr:hypothetical protein [Myxococcales bacterium]
MDKQDQHKEQSHGTAQAELQPKLPYEEPTLVSTEGRPLHALLGSQASCGDTTGGTGDPPFCDQV